MPIRTALDIRNTRATATLHVTVRLAEPVNHPTETPTGRRSEEFNTPRKGLGTPPHRDNECINATAVSMQPLNQSNR